MTEQELPPDLSDWIRSQEFTDKYNAYITEKIELERHTQKLKEQRDIQLEEQEEQRRKLREEYESSPAYKIELEIKKLKQERASYIKKYIQPLHDALSDMGAQCITSICDCCSDDDDDWHY